MLSKFAKGFNRARQGAKKEDATQSPAAEANADVVAVIDAAVIALHPLLRTTS